MTRTGAPPGRPDVEVTRRQDRRLELLAGHRVAVLGQDAEVQIGPGGGVLQQRVAHVEADRAGSTHEAERNSRVPGASAQKRGGSPRIVGLGLLVDGQQLVRGGLP